MTRAVKALSNRASRWFGRGWCASIGQNGLVHRRGTPNGACDDLGQPKVDQVLCEGCGAKRHQRAFRAAGVGRLLGAAIHAVRPCHARSRRRRRVRRRSERCGSDHQTGQHADRHYEAYEGVRGHTPILHTPPEQAIQLLLSLWLGVCSAASRESQRCGIRRADGETCDPSVDPPVTSFPPVGGFACAGLLPSIVVTRTASGLCGRHREFRLGCPCRTATAIA